MGHSCRCKHKKCTCRCHGREKKDRIILGDGKLQNFVSTTQNDFTGSSGKPATAIKPKENQWNSDDKGTFETTNAAYLVKPENVKKRSALKVQDNLGTGRPRTALDYHTTTMLTYRPFSRGDQAQLTRDPRSTQIQLGDQVGMFADATTTRVCL